VLKPRPWQYWGLIGILIVDLLMAGKRVNSLAPEAFFTDEPVLVKRVRQEIGDGKLLRTPDPLPQMFHFPPDATFPVAPDHIMWFYRWQLETLRKYLAASYNIPVIFHDDYDPRVHAILQMSEKPIFSLPFWKGQQPEENMTAPRQCVEPPGQIRITPKRLAAHSSSYSVSTNCDGYFVFSEQFYPGWHVTIDGKPVSLLRANFAFSAILLPAGEHEVLRYYRPDALLIGLMCSFGSLCILALMTYKGWLL